VVNVLKADVSIFEVLKLRSLFMIHRNVVEKLLRVLDFAKDFRHTMRLVFGFFVEANDGEGNDKGTDQHFCRDHLFLVFGIQYIIHTDKQAHGDKAPEYIPKHVDNPSLFALRLVVLEIDIVKAFLFFWNLIKTIDGLEIVETIHQHLVHLVLEFVLFQSILKEDTEHEVNVHIVNDHEKQIGKKSRIRNSVVFIHGCKQDKKFFQEINTEDFQIFEQDRRHTDDFGQNFAGMNIFKVQFVMV
jgi:hypothetical protein